jgi:hypothetical protein
MDRQIADWAADNPKLRASLDSLDAWIDSTMGYNAFAGAVGGYCPRPGAHLGARIGTGECAPLKIGEGLLSQSTAGYKNRRLMETES